MQTRLAIPVLAALVLAGAVHAWAGTVGPGLAVLLAEADNGRPISVLVYLAGAVDVDGLAADLDCENAPLARRHEVVVGTLRDRAAAAQTKIRGALDELKLGRASIEYHGYWLANCVRVDAAPSVIQTIADRTDVARVYLNYPVESVVRITGETASGVLSPRPVEIGIEAVRAPEVWALGITGEGVLVANIDSGVDGAHPALASRWRGAADPRYEGHPEWAWFDPYAGQHDAPYDEVGHGTHTMGTLCGGAPGDAIGVAPGAQWIAAGAVERGGGQVATIADIIESLQWMLDPDGDPATHWDVPAVCCNSWGLADAHGYADCDDLFWSFLDACEAAGVALVFAAGNEGAEGLRRPADRAVDDYRTLAVGAVDAHNPAWPVADDSSRGPTYCTPDGSAAIKPDIAAPGVGVRSSVPGGGYAEYDGTSMAAPHVAGVIALMRQANPDLAVHQIKQIIFETAHDLGAPGKDNDTGWGMIDAYEAVQRALSATTLSFVFPDGLPERIDPQGGTSIRVEVSSDLTPPAPGTGMLHYTIDGESVSIAMSEGEPNVYDAVFPALACPAEVFYHFSAETQGGETVVDPWGAPEFRYVATTAVGTKTIWTDQFEIDTGWTVEDIEPVNGSWVRAIPAGDGTRCDPVSDYDGSGRCYLTGDGEDEDVDNGPTRLISPALDATGLVEPGIEYARWVCSDKGMADPLLVEISDDDGSTWEVVEQISFTYGWDVGSFRIADHATPTATTRLRFTIQDLPNDSVTEAAVDAVRLFEVTCEEASEPADVTGDGCVDVLDLLAVLAAWGTTGGGGEDVTGDGVVDVLDLLEVLGAWGPCS